VATSINRRKLIGAAVASGAAAVVVGNRVVLGQDATPAATPAASDDAGGGFTVNSLAPTATPLGDAVPPETLDPANWALENIDLANTRAYLGSTISSSNIDQLGLSWSFAYDAVSSYGAITSQTTFVGDILYSQDTMSNVFALDKATGEVLWSKEYDLPITVGGPCGVAIGYGIAVYPVGNGGVAAIDATTGDDLWQISLTGPRGEGISMVPGIYNSTVYISTVPGGADGFYNGGQRGIFYALDISTGRVLWYFDTTTDNLWGNPRANSGGGLWHPPAFDADGNIYIDVANPAPWPGNAEYPAGSSRPGENLYTDSIVRLNKDTAGVDWYLKAKDNDFFDLDNQLSPILAEIDGKLTVFASGKHGYVIAADAETGTQLWKTAVGKHENDEITGDQLPDDGETPIEVYPGSLGGVETDLAYADGVIYAALLNASGMYTKGQIASGGTPLPEATGQLVAVNASTGDIIWDVSFPSAQLAAATVVNDLVFTAGLDGVVHALAIADGTEVWSYQATAGINAPIAVNGDTLYVAAGGPLLTSTDTASPAPEAKSQLVALTLGAAATPEA
jgi:outer membrane protein assembly factor BamB